MSFDESISDLCQQLKINFPKEVKKHETIDDLLCMLFNCDIKELDDFSIGSDSAEISLSVFKESIIEQKVWGFVDDNSVIHAWFDPDVPKKELLHFICHEFAHLNDFLDKDDEVIAEKVALISIESYNIVENLLSK